MKLVIDTNVLVSALLTRGGVCDQLLTAFDRVRPVFVVDERILIEYRTVLNRPRFGFSATTVDDTITRIVSAAEFVDVATWSGALTDESDRPFIEVAIAGNADIVTGNSKHFPPSLPVRVITPREALAKL